VAHIFPLAQESYWTEHDYGRWILDTPESTGVAKINAPQNGILLESGMHKQFDEYLVSVNPDVDRYLFPFISPPLVTKLTVLAAGRLQDCVFSL
jgi:hypothetical protein